MSGAEWCQVVLSSTKWQIVQPVNTDVVRKDVPGSFSGSGLGSAVSLFRPRPLPRPLVGVAAIRKSYE